MKFSPSFIGPYTISSRVKPVSYKLHLLWHLKFAHFFSLVSLKTSGAEPIVPDSYPGQSSVQSFPGLRSSPDSGFVYLPWETGLLNRLEPETLEGAEAP